MDSVVKEEEKKSPKLCNPCKFTSWQQMVSYFYALETVKMYEKVTAQTKADENSRERLLSNFTLRGLSLPLPLPLSLSLSITACFHVICDEPNFKNNMT